MICLFSISHLYLDEYYIYIYIHMLTAAKGRMLKSNFFLCFLADIDPCLKNNGGCSHNCSLEKGKLTCTCPVGYKLTYDLRRCKGL